LRGAGVKTSTETLPASARAPSSSSAVALPFWRLAGSGLVWGGVTATALAVWILWGLGGLDYYRVPLAIRGYAPVHPALRPSGPVGETLGVAGALLLLVPFAYMGRKRFAWLKGLGSPRVWLEIHLFCGVVGPVLITFHTSFKFNGVVSAAYWSMVLVMLSGFVGRYLYVRIPRSIRGTELTRIELDQEASVLAAELESLVPSAPLLLAVRAFERAAIPEAARLSAVDLLFGELTMGRRLRGLDAALRGAGVDDDLRKSIVSVTSQRSMLLRRTAYLQKTKALFDLWHVFHLPLVYLLLVIAAVHVAIVLYLGYLPFRW